MWGYKSINRTEHGDPHAHDFSKASIYDNEPYRLSVEQCVELYHTDLDNGLHESKIDSLIHQYGANNLGDDHTISYMGILAHQLFNAMVLVLIISMVITFCIKDWISAGVIAFVVFINVFVGFIQEIKAEKTMGSLRSLSSPSATVIRSGNTCTINAEELVPGDIVKISVGDTIPADLRLANGINFETDEALLTGESLPVAKNPEKVYMGEEAVPVGDRLNIAYSSSVVTKGRATGIVVATGLHQEIGKIADSLKSSDEDIIVKPSAEISTSKAFAKTFLNIIQNVLGTNVGTPLQRKLSWMAILLFFVAVVFAIIVMASHKMVVNTTVAIYAICVALSMIPSSLVVVLTITMAVGAEVMVTKNVIVRKLDSLEALGGIDDICSDKTGTLTLGKMIVKKVWVSTVGTYVVNDCTEVYDPTVGTVGFHPASPKQIDEMSNRPKFDSEVSYPNIFRKWITAATLANVASVYKIEDKWEAQGDATETAICVFTKRLGYERAEIIESQNLEHLSEFPFDSSIKRMSSVYGTEKEATVYTKGAVERILERCDNWYGTDPQQETLVPLTADDKALIEENMDTLSKEGLRVLAFAERSIDTAESLEDRDTVESGLTFLGLVGIYDPPRPETKDSVRLCHNAGINVHMLTGDMLGTARAIAKEVGILPSNLYHYSQEVKDAMCMTATQFDGLSNDEIDRLPVLPLVIARCAPQTKVRMIEALHRRGKFCAMTGDGVNDSPSLKKADVGIAMGLNGSDVAKDAADLVLTDDNFASILHAIEEGRRMSSNIQKFVLQLLAQNVAQALYLLVGLAFVDSEGYSVFPLSPVEVLWIIVVTSCFPAMGLGQEQASDDILELPPNKRTFTKELVIDMFVYGAWMALCCMVMFVCVIYGIGNGDLGETCNVNSHGCGLVFEGRSTAFAGFTWCALLLAWECIHMRYSFFNMRPESEDSWYVSLARDLWANQFLLWSIVLASVSVFPVIYIPVINEKVFLHGPIGREWGIAVALTIVFLVGCEGWKWAKRVYFRRKSPRIYKDKESIDPFSEFSSIMTKSGTSIQMQRDIA
ncbi:putative Na(+)-exporting P-type ATPase [Saccharomycopsis crataegensis]|uniref:P-type Na(+) transporter n=1 Tax=Saccharomycopsis crataegensis TaxID=43959 RepID=A0AAV5QI38_9ASCO|nr:putative Na(+)-exporting P-type ATPase [Saccharomycopsis crataegensis]